MSTEISFKDYSLSPADLLPPDDDDLDADDHQIAWADYVAEAQRVPTDDVLLTVTDLLSNDVTLRAMVEAVKAHPYEPGERRRVHVSVAVKLAEAVELLIDQVLDEQVSMRLAIGGAA